MKFLDLNAQFQKHQEKIRRKIEGVLEHGRFILGPEGEELEKTLAKRVNRKHCVGVGSGTDALLMALMQYDVGPGDLIFTTPFTFIATAEVVCLLGAKPVFVDIDPETWMLCPKELEKALAKYTDATLGKQPKGIVAVDLFGAIANYTEIDAIAKKHGLFLLSDAAQSFGASLNGVAAGKFGDVCATSFFPAKPLGAYGDGGALFTDDDAIYERLLSIRMHGMGAHRYEHIRLGLNGRLDTLQAAVLLAKLEFFDTELAAKQQLAEFYKDNITGYAFQKIPEGCQSAWAQFSLLSPNRDKILERLKEKNIPFAIHYPKPLHHQPVFAHLHDSGNSLRVSEKISREVFSLPMHPYLQKEERMAIVDALNSIS